MTTKYDDEILELSTQWISMDEIVKDHNEDKQNIIQAVNRLENMGYLESRNIKNIILYKNQNKVQDHIQFSTMMETFLVNQKKEIEDIKIIPSIMLSDGSQFGFSKKGLELLEHVQEEIDRVHMIITRTDPFLFLISAMALVNIDFGTSVHSLNDVFHVARPAV